MRVRLNFKTPDATFYALQDIKENLSDPDSEDFISDEDEREDKLAEIEGAIGKFVGYGECVSIVIDTELETAEVLTS